ncbi:expressed unknown protein [Seminavis robusta]|uniref:Uncharacterized protein n=1 Tax=Seminavis robusta TaxID=568900 RepID=A0A9N8DB85_9STRA|nr:expressed unknown protein [Seminavis robusta]|eukprot:Sro18_g012660.1 n/a (846) ;mRNA; f:722-3363
MTPRKSIRIQNQLVSDEADVEAETAAAVDDAVDDAAAESTLSFFDSSKRFISFNMCAEAQEWPGLPAHLGAKWYQVLNDDGLSRTTLDKMAMAFLDTSEQVKKIAEGEIADHYLRTFILSAFLKEVPHLITTNFFVIGTKGLGKIATIFSVCNQLQEESDDNKLRWLREVVGQHKWKPLGFKSEKPSRNALVGECLSLGMRCFEALCHGEAAKMDELRLRLISLLKKIAEQADKLMLPPQAWDYAKIEGWGYRKFGRGKGLAMSIDFLQRVQEDPENHILGLNRADFTVLKEAMQNKTVGAWMRGDTQLALFYLTWMDEPMLAFLCRMLCSSLKSVADVKAKAEEMMADVPKETQDVFIEFARHGSRCLGSETLVPDLRLSGIEKPKDRELKQEQRDLEEVDTARNRRETQKKCMDNFIESAAMLLKHLLVPEHQHQHQQRHQSQDATKSAQRRQQRRAGVEQEAQRRQAEEVAANVEQLEDNPTVNLDDSVGGQREQQQRRQGATAVEDAAEMERKELRSQLEDACAREDDLKTKLQSAENGRNEALSQLGNVQQELKAARAQRSEANSKLADVQGQNQSAVADKERAESQLKESQEQLNTVLASRDALTEELTKSKDREKSLKAQVDTVIRELDTFERALNTGERALNTCERALRDSQETGDRLMAELSNLQFENERLAQRLMKMSKMNKMLAAKKAENHQNESTELEVQTTITTQQMPMVAAPDACASFGEQSPAKVSEEGDQMTGDGIAGIDEPRQKTKRDATEGRSKSQGNGNINNQRSKKQRLESSVTTASPCTNRGSSSTGQVRVKCESVSPSAPNNPPVKKKYDPEVLVTAVVKKEC